MREVKIKVEPFSFVSFLKVECVKELNNHGVIRIIGIIEQENSSAYMSMAAQETWVTVNAISEDDYINRFFVGILTGLWMKREGQVSILTIEVKTGSFLFCMAWRIF